MAGELTAAEGALRTGAEVVSTARGDLRTELNTLEGKLQGLAGQWDSASAAAFQRLITRWRENANKIIGSLDEFEANLLDTQTSYDTTDDSGRDTMNALAARLD